MASVSSSFWLQAVFLYALFAAQPSEAGDGEVEIRFEPMVIGGGGSPDDVFSALLGGGPIRSQGRSSGHAGEANLDQMLEQMLRGMGGPPPRERSRGALRGDPFASLFGGSMGGDGPFSGRRGNPFGDGTVVIEGGRPGSPQIIEMSSGAMGGRSGPSGLPAGLLRDLFPGPLMMGGESDHPQPFDAPDPAIQDLMSSLDQMFMGTILPMVHKSASVGRAPNACKGDIKAHCEGAKSQIHCLGQHQADISQACHKDIGKSVPFRCSSYIDKFCDLLEGGILSCLQAHIQDLDDNCKDSVLATAQVISKANTEKASVIDPATGATKFSEPVATTGGGASSNPSVAAMLSLANTGSDVAKDVQSWAQERAWSFFAAVSVAMFALALYALTYTPYYPRKLRALFSSDKVESNALLKGVEMPKPTDEYLS